MEKILIIEDDEDIAELERDYLEAAGFQAEILGNGQEGEKRALDPEIALVLLDIMLPGEDGFQVCRKIRAHLKRYQQLTGQNQASKLLIRGDLTIDCAGHRVYVGGKEVVMPNKEFALLEFLAENPGQVFSKETLFQRIWGEDSLGDTATVSVHVNRIREKIEKSTAKPEYIETVWGVGYRFKK